MDHTNVILAVAGLAVAAAVIYAWHEMKTKITVLTKGIGADALRDSLRRQGPPLNLNPNQSPDLRRGVASR
jgi:hypothetical protein